MSRHPHRKISGRAADERLLQWLNLRARGISQSDIGLRFGVHGGHVSRDITQVISDDLRLSGDPAEVVRAGYPWRRFDGAAK